MRVLDAWESDDGSELVLTVCGKPNQHSATCEWDLGPDAFVRRMIERPPKNLVSPGVDLEGNPLPLSPKAYKYEDDETRLNRAIRDFKGRFEARKPSGTRERVRKRRDDLVGTTV